MSELDKDTTVEHLAKKLGVSLGTLYVYAKRANLPVAGRTAEQHQDLVAAITAMKKAPAAKRKVAKPIAKRAPAARMKKATKPAAKKVPVAGSPPLGQFGDVVESLFRVLGAIQPLTSEQRKCVLTMATACLEASE